MPAVTVDGADSDGRLKAVGSTHGVSPYPYNGSPSCVLFYQSGRAMPLPRSGGGRPERSTLSWPNSSCLRAHELTSAEGNFENCLTQFPQCRAGNRLKIRVPSIFQSLFGWFLSQVFTGRMILSAPQALRTEPCGPARESRYDESAELRSGRSAERSSRSGELPAGREPSPMTCESLGDCNVVSMATNKWYAKTHRKICDSTLCSR